MTCLVAVWFGSGFGGVWVVCSTVVFWLSLDFWACELRFVGWGMLLGSSCWVCGCFVVTGWVVWFEVVVVIVWYCGLAVI